MFSSYQDKLLYSLTLRSFSRLAMLVIILLGQRSFRADNFLHRQPPMLQQRPARKIPAQAVLFLPGLIALAFTGR